MKPVSRVIVMFLLGLATRTMAQSDGLGLALFESRIRPVLVEHCYGCHSAKAHKVKGGLRLDSREDMLKGGDSGPAIVPGDPDRSRLIKAVRHLDKDLAMPRGPAGSQKLPDPVIADLARWVEIGAPYPAPNATNPRGQDPKAKHWAFQPVQDPSVPAVRNAAWARTSIDPFVLAQMEAAGHAPAGPADKRTLLRRATFDLTGLPPTPEEIDAFVHDSAPDAFARVVDRLLQSPRYGEQWGRHWLDVVRYADTAGDTADYPVPVAWRYRNYVIDAFNADKPYDEFIREQVAGDILARQGSRERYAERVTATGYLALSRRFGFDSENYHHLTIQDTIDTLGQSVLGLTLGCARCHNHKFDPVSSAEYYGLYGIFESTRYAFPGSEQKQKYRALVPLVPVEESRPKWREFEARLATVGHNPEAVLRSLDDLDGDFEMQRVASGGSKGVLVPPWLYAGNISVTQEAQSPFRHLHPFGSVGVSIPANTGTYVIQQALHPARRQGLVYVNLDFRAATNATGAIAAHRFWIGAQDAGQAVEVLIGSDAIWLPGTDGRESIRLPRPGQWHNLQLTLDMHTRTFSGAVSATNEARAFQDKSFAPAWNGVIDFVAIGAAAQSNDVLPAADFDNVAVQDSPIPPVSTALPPALAAAQTPGAKQALNQLLAEGPLEMAYGVTEGTPHNTRVQLRGDPDKLGEEVPRGFVKVLGGDAQPTTFAGSGRLELAQWLTRPENPLTARVLVNRLWQYHFGEGLVRTPNDFGARGQAPTHPALLDHLATRFIQSGWSIKAMHRLILLSAAYQQDSAPSQMLDMSSTDIANASIHAPQPHPGGADAVFPRRRLNAEELRDAILFVCGQLDLTPGRGHPFPVATSWGYTQHAPFEAVYEHHQRSVYLMTQRLKRHPFLALFDGADPNSSSPDRRVTTVPTQALYFLNDPFVHAQSERLADRLRGAAPDQGARIALAYRLAYGRFPNQREQAQAVEFLAAYQSELSSGQGDAGRAALAAFARVLFGSNEFVSID